MEYTKDVIFNVKHTNNIATVRLKKMGLFNRLYKTIKDNKFITTILLTMATLVIVNIILVNMFMNLLVTL